MLPCSVQSPDMNLIENAFAILNKNLGQDSTNPNNRDNLFNRLLGYGILYLVTTSRE